MKQILVLLLCGLLAFLSGCGLDRSSSSSFENSQRGQGTVDHTRTEAEIKEDLKTREKSNPQKYLSFDGTYRRNFFEEMVIEGSISSSATIARFKDAVIEITGFSKTESEIGVWHMTIYEVFQPGRTRNLEKIKLMLPSTVKTISVSVVDAVPLS
ncbi:MAG TPA: hypothetical protein VHS96_11980 [Bacteroidia bacterium]|nr:hypothetical protein [Bacteroidia bacterium]